MKTATLLTNAPKLCALMLGAFCAVQSAKASDYTVEMTSDWTFNPSYVVVEAGDMVTWVNHDWAWYVHDSVCPGYWDTDLLDVDESASVIFPYSGTYNYKDSNFYIFGMKGTVVVLPKTPSVPTPATLVDPQLLPGGVFQFSVSNLMVGATYVVQVSTDLVNWSDVITTTAGSEIETWVDNDAATVPQRFYRTKHTP